VAVCSLTACGPGRITNGAAAPTTIAPADPSTDVVDPYDSTLPDPGAEIGADPSTVPPVDDGAAGAIDSASGSTDPVDDQTSTSSDSGEFPDPSDASILGPNPTDAPADDSGDVDVQVPGSDVPDESVPTTDDGADDQPIVDDQPDVDPAPVVDAISFSTSCGRLTVRPPDADGWRNVEWPNDVASRRMDLNGLGWNPARAIGIRTGVTAFVIGVACGGSTPSIGVAERYVVTACGVVRLTSSRAGIRTVAWHTGRTDGELNLAGLGWNDWPGIDISATGPFDLAVRCSAPGGRTSQSLSVQ